MCAPARQRISIHRIKQRLRNRLEEVLWLLHNNQHTPPLTLGTHIPYQIRLPQALARPEQLITRRATDDEILRKVNASNTIKAADKRLPRLRIEPRDDGTDEVRPEAALVQGAGDEVRERRGRDRPLLAQAVHVDFVAEEVGHGGHVGGEARQPEVDGAVGEDLGEVVGHGEGLEAEAQVARDGDAVFAHHGDAGSAIWGVEVRGLGEEGGGELGTD